MAPDSEFPLAHAPVVPLFLKRTLGGGSLVIQGDGRQTRDFVHIDDVVQALAAAASTERAVGPGNQRRLRRGNLDRRAGASSSGSDRESSRM